MDSRAKRIVSLLLENEDKVEEKQEESRQQEGYESQNPTNMIKKAKTKENSDEGSCQSLMSVSLNEDITFDPQVIKPQVIEPLKFGVPVCKQDPCFSQSNELITLNDLLGDVEVAKHVCNPDDKLQSIEERENVETELIDLFGSDFSDEDPTYEPPKHTMNSRNVSSDDSITATNDSLEDCTPVPSTERAEVQPLATHLPLTPSTSGGALTICDNVIVVSSNANESPAPNENIQPSKKLSRWRKVDPDGWAENIAKKMRIDGLPYVTKKKPRPAKVPQTVNCNECFFKCTENFSNEARNTLCRNYWSLDYKGRKNFILSNIEVTAPKRRITERTSRKPRTFSKKCFFFKNDNKIQVCQMFFTKTLCISKDTIIETVQKRDTFGFFSEADKRGKKEPANKTKAEVMQRVKTHIESFPSMESHYVRKKSQKKYLDSRLSITKMYRLYLAQCESDSIQAVSEITYRRTFSTDYNLSFYKPKKDQCLICTNYNKADTNGKIKLEENFKERQKRKTECNLQKEDDKTRANSDPKFKSVTFDLQALLQIPCSSEGLLYYSRKLNMYNLTVYEADLPNRAFCFAWTEINGKRGSAEIASILHYYLTHCLQTEVTQISLFSDTCSGQNRNQFVAAMLLWCVQNIKNLQIIDQKFLESGHTYMEVDSMHSSIETAKKNTPVYSIIDWINIFKHARKERTVIDTKNKKTFKIEPYQVKEFKYNEFFDVKSLAEVLIKNRTRDSEGHTVKWLKIKWLRFEKSETDKIYFKYNMMDQFKYILINKPESSNPEPTPPLKSYNTRRSGNHLTLTARNENVEVQEFPNTLKILYNKPLPISSAKKKDLLNLCKKGIIPEELHPWYSGLCSSTDIVECIPESDSSGPEEAS